MGGLDWEHHHTHVTACSAWRSGPGEAGSDPRL